MKAGHRVLVNGAAGGVGTYALQIAAALGAGVTGVCSTRNVAGKLTPVLDRTYPLADTAEGLRRVEQGHARGKVVITVP